MSFLQKLWNWLNGNKTVFGLVLLQIGQSIPETDLLFGFLPLKETVLWLGGILTGTGAAHKLLKSNTEPGPNG